MNGKERRDRQKKSAKEKQHRNMQPPLIAMHLEVYSNSGRTTEQGLKQNPKARKKTPGETAGSSHTKSRTKILDCSRRG
jgi:hypothetical protein